MTDVDDIIFPIGRTFLTSDPNSFFTSAAHHIFKKYTTLRKANPSLADPSISQHLTCVLEPLPPFKTFHSSVKKNSKCGPEAVLRVSRGDILFCQGNTG